MLTKKEIAKFKCTLETDKKPSSMKSPLPTKKSKELDAAYSKGVHDGFTSLLLGADECWCNKCSKKRYGK